MKHTKYLILTRCYEEPPKTKSDFARYYASELAMSASLGLITTFVPAKGFTHHWHITTKGLKELSDLPFDLKAN